MKKLLGIDIVGTAILTPGASGVGTVTFTGPTLGLEQILIITNVTRNVIIYNFADAAAGEAAYSNNVLTLQFNTSSHSASDVLQAFVDVPEASYPLSSVANRTDNLIVMLSRIVKLLESNAVVDSAQRQRVAIDAAIPTGANVIGAVNIAASQTLANVTTVATVSNVTATAGMDREQYINIAKQTYRQSIRSNLEFV